jgi:hypothetical protein
LDQNVSGTKKLCHPERSIRKIIAPPFGAMKQCRRESNGPAFLSMRETDLSSCAKHPYDQLSASLARNVRIADRPPTKQYGTRPIRSASVVLAPRYRAMLQ